MPMNDQTFSNYCPLLTTDRALKFKMNEMRTHRKQGNQSRHPLKRISSRLVIAVLVAVLLPFFGLIYFIDSQIHTRLKENIVERSLLSLATDLANEVNPMMRKRNSDLLLMTTDILGDRSIAGKRRKKFPPRCADTNGMDPCAIERKGH